MRHVISVLLENEVGALTRMAGLFSTRGYNIESLNVAPTDDPRVSRVTVVSTGSDAVIAQIVGQMGKLIDVVNIHDMTLGEHFERELLLLKLAAPAEKLDGIKALMRRFGAQELDGAAGQFTLELLATVARVDAFLEEVAALAPISTVVRSGSVAISRGEAHLGPDSVPVDAGDGGRA